MPNFNKQLPLSLYIHIPWCVKKCPYCDFNSHEAKNTLPQELYVDALLQELDQHLPSVNNRSLVSIFFGGGTPSLFGAHSIEKILNGVAKKIVFEPNIEITLEANPGTIDQANFKDYRHAGINRLSMGIQSLQDEKLKALGRIHDSAQAKEAISVAKQAGFTNFNLDIMYGLPNQSIEEAKQDIQQALTFEPTHFSWYQLTIEPNTLFYHQKPVLPPDDYLWEMQQTGQRLIAENFLQQYEVSAYSLAEKQCVHNKNYWEFGDYLGIGAGAHSKITDITSGMVTRFSQVKNPRDYLEANKRLNQTVNQLSEQDLVFEFMLNALRLTQGIRKNLLTERTGLNMTNFRQKIEYAKERGLLIDDHTHLCPSELGKQFLNDLVGIFLSV